MNNADDFDERGKALVTTGGTCIHGWSWGDTTYITVSLRDLKHAVQLRFTQGYVRYNKA